MMNRLSRYLRPLLVVEDRLPWFLPVVGAVLLAVTSNLIYDVLRTALGPLGTVIALLVMLVFGVMLVALAFRQERVPPQYQVKDRPKPHPYRGLVILVSAKPVVKHAMEYHLPELKSCWLIVTPESVPMAAEIQKEYYERVECHQCEIEDEYDTEGCSSVVKRIFSQDIYKDGLTAAQVIADITGGTKPMTAGMLLACLSGGYNVEHTPSQYTVDAATGRRIPVRPLDPIEIDIRLLNQSVAEG